MLFDLACHVAGNALTGLVTMVVGHAILRATSLPGYDPSVATSVRIGAVGGCIMAIPSGVIQILYALIPVAIWKKVDPESGKSIYARRSLSFLLLAGVLSLGWCVALGAAIGAIGAAIFEATHKSGLDVVHAAKAGALGGTILGPGALLVVMMFICFGGGCFGLWVLLFGQRQEV